MDSDETARVVNEDDDDRVKQLAAQAARRGSYETAQLLEPYSDEVVVRVLQGLNPSTVQDVLDELSPARRQALIAAAPPPVGVNGCTTSFRRQWLSDGSVDRVLRPDETVVRPSSTCAKW